MHHPTDRITHTTIFVTPVVEHWLERESSRTMLLHTCSQWPWLLSRNVDSNLSKTHSILLAPSDYYLYPQINKELGGHHFARDDDDDMNAEDHFLRDQNDAFCTEGIRLLHDRWSKCVNVGRDYVNKLLHLIF